MKIIKLNFKQHFDDKNINESFKNSLQKLHKSHVTVSYKTVSSTVLKTKDLISKLWCCIPGKRKHKQIKWVDKLSVKLPL